MSHLLHARTIHHRDQPTIFFWFTPPSPGPLGGMGFPRRHRPLPPAGTQRPDGLHARHIVGDPTFVIGPFRASLRLLSMESLRHYIKKDPGLPSTRPPPSETSVSSALRRADNARTQSLSRRRTVSMIPPRRHHLPLSRSRTRTPLLRGRSLSFLIFMLPHNTRLPSPAATSLFLSSINLIFILIFILIPASRASILYPSPSLP